MLILQFHNHPHSFSFIGELVAHTASRPLMDLLIGLSANINMLPKISNVADDHGLHALLHALLIERGNKSRCLLMFDILDLILDFSELLLLRFDQLFAATGPLLFPVDFLAQLFLQLVLILPFSTKYAPIDDMCMGTIMRDSHMDLTQIDTCNLPSNGESYWLNLVGCNGFVLSTCPVDDNRLGKLPSPIKYKRLIPFAIGKGELAILESDRTTLVFNAEVPSAFVRRLGIWIRFSALSPRLERSKESLHTGIRGMSVQLRRGEQSHQVLWFEPNSLMPDSPPKEDQCLGVEFPASMSKLIELRCLADVDSSQPDT